MGNLNTLINWFKTREGKVTYSMSNRNGPNSYDCSSAVYHALIESGFLPKGTGIGNTESLYRLEGTLLQPISRNVVTFGDIFVSGVKGGSSGGAGHTGVALSNSQIIHCNYTANGISTTSITNANTGIPCYWYRLKGIENDNQPAANENLMTCIYKIEGDNTTYYFDGFTIKGISNSHELEILNKVFRANTGKNIPDLGYIKKDYRLDANLKALLNRKPIV